MQRSLLRFFSDEDLAPLPGQLDPDRSAKVLLSETDLNELRTFADEFSRQGEVCLQRAQLSRKASLRCFISFLSVLGAVSVSEAGPVTRIKPRGRLGRHLPQILAIFFTRSFTIIDGWDRTHGIPEDQLGAVELVHQLELRRIELSRRMGESPEPLAERPVAFAVFHALNGHGESCYLFELNKDWRRLNLIGGKQEREDGGDYLQTVSREVSEELGISRDRLTFVRLNDTPIPGFSLSGNAGSLAYYPCVLFGVTVRGDFQVRLSDRWLTEKTIKACGRLRDSPIMVNPAYLGFLLEGRPSRLSRLPLSTHSRVKSPDIRDLVPDEEPALNRWLRVMNENKDMMAAIITLVAALITLVLTFK
jgi:hypothetical protein